MLPALCYRLSAETKRDLADFEEEARTAGDAVAAALCVFGRIALVRSGGVPYTWVSAEDFAALASYRAADPVGLTPLEALRAALQLLLDAAEDGSPKAKRLAADFTETERF